MAEPIITSLEDKHFTCLNHSLMQGLGTIGQAFYMRLFFHFANMYDGHQKSRVSFFKRYDDICAEWLGGLAVHKFKSVIERDQLGPHLHQLVDAAFLTSYTLEPAKTRDGFVITFKPGRTFFEDYDRFYRKQQHGAVRSSFNADRQEIKEPLQVAYLFAEKKTGRPASSIGFVNSKDVETAPPPQTPLPKAGRPSPTLPRPRLALPPPRAKPPAAPTPALTGYLPGRHPPRRRPGPRHRPRPSPPGRRPPPPGRPANPPPPGGDPSSPRPPEKPPRPKRKRPPPPGGALPRPPPGEVVGGGKKADCPALRRPDQVIRRMESDEPHEVSARSAATPHQRVGALTQETGGSDPTRWGLSPKHATPRITEESRHTATVSK